MHGLVDFDRFLKEQYLPTLRMALDEPWKLDLLRLQDKVNRLEKKVAQQKEKLRRAAALVNELRKT